MKNLLKLALAMACVTALTVTAAEEKKKERPPLTDDQKKAQKELIEKYDANKDGRIDQDERAKMTPEDREKAGKAGLGGGKKKKDA